MGDRTVNSFKVGSRKSELALIQTNYVIASLEQLHPGCTFEIVSINTMGDKILDKALPKIGEKSLFTKELEEALHDGSIDFVVHSLKDLPTTLPHDLAIGAILKREDPRDALILHEKHKGLTLETLPKNSVIGTSSLRRTAQLRRRYPHLKISNIRGNLNTRLKKLDDGSLYDGIVLAAAGINRIGWQHRINQNLEPEDVLYAVGQGALAVECKEGNREILEILKSIVHRDSALIVLAERSFLRKLEGGCSAPVAVNSMLIENTLKLTGFVSSLDGDQVLSHTMEAKFCDEDVIKEHIDYYRNEFGEPPKKCPFKLPKLYCGISGDIVNYLDMEIAEKLGTDLATVMIKMGALEIMDAAKKEVHNSSNQLTKVDLVCSTSDTSSDVSKTSEPSEAAKKEIQNSLNQLTSVEVVCLTSDTSSDVSKSIEPSAETKKQCFTKSDTNDQALPV